MNRRLDPGAALPTRRDILHWMSAAGLLGATASVAAQSLAIRSARAAPLNSGKKILTVFLRGGNDGLNTLIPLHDADYSALGTRPTLRIPANLALDLGNGGAAFHPAMSRALEVFQAGELCAVARVGYANSSLSHFSSQRFFETAVPGDDSMDEGWVARWARIEAPADALAAASVSAQVQRMYLGPQVVAHVPDLAQYALSSDPLSLKILGSNTHGLGSAYAAAPGAGYDALVRKTGTAMRESLLALSTLAPLQFATDSFPADPAACAALGLPSAWWAATFLANVRDALQILLASECTIAGVEMQGFDHHSAQGGVVGDHAARLSVIAHALRSLRREAQQAGAWNDLVVLVVSEFGRTSRENGSAGTDHGRAGVTLLAGGRVIGGVHHCDPISWPSGATLFSDAGKYIAHRTDYRALYAEVLRHHLQISDPDLDSVIPGFTQLSGPEFQELGLFL